MILSHAEILSRCALSRNRISFHLARNLWSGGHGRPPTELPPSASCDCEIRAGNQVFAKLPHEPVLLFERVQKLAPCGPHSTDPSTETLTIYEDAPTLTPLDLGPPGNSPGDAYYFSAPIYSSLGGRLIGEAFGSKTLIKLAAQANPNSEKRATLLFFTFAEVRIKS